VDLHIVYLRIIDVVPLVKLGGIARKKRSRVIRTRSWFEAAGIVERVLGSRYPVGAQVGDSIIIKNVREEWDGQWQHHYKIIVSHLDTKCATCGFHPTECICDDPVI
jgi:hypothetical protein